MNKAIKLLGIIALTTIIAFSMLACDGSGEGSGAAGTLVITKIRAPYDDGNHYADLIHNYMDANGNHFSLLGGESYTANSITPARIIDGRVELKLWKVIFTGGGASETTRYNGNETITGISVYLRDWKGDGETITLRSIKFTNGGAVVSAP
jgi:hypothetical protein